MKTSMFVLAIVLVTGLIVIRGINDFSKLKLVRASTAWANEDKKWASSSHDCANPLTTSYQRLMMALMHCSVALEELRELKARIDGSNGNPVLLAEFITSGNNLGFYSTILPRLNPKLTAELRDAATGYLKGAKPGENVELVQGIHSRCEQILNQYDELRPLWFELIGSLDPILKEKMEALGV